MEAFSAGTVAGAGSFHCESCGYAIALHETDEVPSCPRCASGRFSRASIFLGGATDMWTAPAVEHPDWLEEAREALVEPGHYLAFEDDERLRVAPLQQGWTRVGRSLAAQLRLDDPTVSRRHALVHCEGDTVRVLDDRSLNGVWVNGERVDWRQLRDRDELTIGRYRLYFLALARAERSTLPI